MYSNMPQYEGEAVILIGLCRNPVIGLCRADDPPLARGATAGSPARQAGQSNWSAPSQGPVGLKLAELVSTSSLFRVWGVFHYGP
jgi:hypothetical protein